MFLYSYFSFSCGINIKIVNYNSNNMENRSRTEIVAMILDAANKEEKLKQKLCTLLF
jgi:predicted transcriptional regulator